MIRSNSTWIDEHIPELKDKILLTLSMEGCIPELRGDAREANVKGGLGVYFGDKLEGLSAIGMRRAFGCMPLYKKRLIQLIRYGSQHIEYKEVSYDDQPIEQVINSKGNPMVFDAWGWDINNTSHERKYNVEIYKINRGGTLLYLFYCPEVFDILYPDDQTHCGCGREHRFLQETIYAQCVYGLLKCINVVPDIIHLNEGHVADAAAIIKGDKAFENTSIVYTNHTVVPAGLERYYVNRVTKGDTDRARYAMRFLETNYESSWEKFTTYQDGECVIDFSKGALEICDIANGVSAEHAEATQGLFPYYNQQVEAVLNGSGDTWVMDELVDASLKDIVLDKSTLLKIAEEGKAISFDEVKKRTAGMTDRDGQIISEDGVTLDPNLPTVWLVRRMVKYKSQLPVLKDIIHVICANKDEEVDTRFGRMNGLQMQVVAGGIAPLGSCEEGWVQEFVSWMKRPELRGRFVYVPNSDTTLLKMQGIGADICINCPMPEMEACGTSDQRTARNGGINIATRSGGPLEYIEDGQSGMLVGPYENEADFYNRASYDILDKLRQLSEMYYDQEENNNRWLDMKLNSYLASSKVSAAAMEERYADLYFRVLNNRESVALALTNKRISELYTEHAIKGNESISDLVYQDIEPIDNTEKNQLCKTGEKIHNLPPGLNIETERLGLFKDIMNSYFNFVKNGSIPDLKDNGSISRFSHVDASLLLFSVISKYLKRTKDYDFLDIMVERIFPDKQTSIVKYMLREIIESYSKDIKHEEKNQEITESVFAPIYASMKLKYQ